MNHLFKKSTPVLFRGALKQTTYYHRISPHLYCFLNSHAASGPQRGRPAGLCRDLSDPDFSQSVKNNPGIVRWTTEETDVVFIIAKADNNNLVLLWMERDNNQIVDTGEIYEWKFGTSLDEWNNLFSINCIHSILKISFIVNYWLKFEKPTLPVSIYHYRVANMVENFILPLYMKNKFWEMMKIYDIFYLEQSCEWRWYSKTSALNVNFLAIFNRINQGVWYVKYRYELCC